MLSRLLDIDDYIDFSLIFKDLGPGGFRFGIFGTPWACTKKKNLRARVVLFGINAISWKWIAIVGIFHGITVLPGNCIFQYLEQTQTASGC